MKINKYMLDTSVINHIIEDENKITTILTKFKDCEFYISHIQRDELDAMKNLPACQTKFNLAIEFLNRVNIISMPTSVFCLDYSRLEAAMVGEGSFYKLLLDELSRQRSRNSNNIKDAIIADTAYSNELPLIVDDGKLFNAIILHGGVAFKLEELLILN